jgi:hypothetical protein
MRASALSGPQLKGTVGGELCHASGGFSSIFMVLKIPRAQPCAPRSSKSTLNVTTLPLTPIRSQPERELARWKALSPTAKYAKSEKLLILSVEERAVRSMTIQRQS